MPDIDLAQMQELLRAGNFASGELAGLNEKHQQAAAQRDTPTAKSTGNWGGVLRELGNTYTRQKGRTALEGLDAQRANARSQIAEANTGKTVYGLEQAQAKRLQDQLNTENKAEALVQSADLANTNKSIAAEKIANATTAEREVVNAYPTGEAPTPENTRSFALGNDGVLRDNDGNPVTDYTLVGSGGGGVNVTQYSGSDKGGIYGSGSAASSAEKASVIANNKATRIIGMIAKGKALSESDKEFMDSPMQAFKAGVLKKITPDSVEKYAQDWASNLSPAGKQWAADVALSIAEGRHDIFGSAVTASESDSAGEIFAKVMNAPQAAILRALQSRGMSALNTVKQNDATYGVNRGFANVQSPDNQAWYVGITEALAKAQQEQADAQKQDVTNAENRMQGLTGTGLFQAMGQQEAQNTPVAIPTGVRTPAQELRMKELQARQAQGVTQ